MTNKRDLKNVIKIICGDIAGECIYVKSYVDGIDEEGMDEIICKVAILQMKTIDKVSVCFDKTLSSFEGNNKEYRKARKAYYKKCYAELMKEFKEAIGGIVHEMNALLPQEVKDANKAALKA